jgi:hypothetical protein
MPNCKQQLVHKAGTYLSRFQSLLAAQVRLRRVSSRPDVIAFQRALVRRYLLPHLKRTIVSGTAALDQWQFVFRIFAPGPLARRVMQPA